MNEIERAINLLKHRVEIIKDMIAYNMNFEPKSDNSSLEEQKKAMDVAISSLEKQIPKKPTHITADKDTKVGSFIFRKGCKLYSCKCGEWVGYRDKFCKHCGQKLDWSVEE